MSKLFTLLIFLSLNSHADEELTPELFIQHSQCVSYKKQNHCIGPEVCQAFSASSMGALNYLAAKAGRPYLGFLIPGAFVLIGEYCKKPHCYDLNICTKWALTM